MDLKLKNQRFVVCGASSGFGRATAEQLLNEGAHIIPIARREEKLAELEEQYPEQVDTVAGDLTKAETHNEIESAIGNEQLHGMVINGGGPPALSPLETAMPDWDQGYKDVMRWKIELTLRLAAYFTKNDYGRIIFIESQSVKQPNPDLVLSASFRAGVIGFAKSLATEIADQGVTVNTIAPGSHNTPAIERVIKKQVDEGDKSYDEVKAEMEASIPVGRFGEGSELASLATWLLSEHSGFVTGQTISHTGGNVSGLFG